MQHLPTILVAAIVAAVFVAIVANEIKKYKKGEGCGCGCGSCGMRDTCHSAKKPKE